MFYNLVEVPLQVVLHNIMGLHGQYQNLCLQEEDNLEVVELQLQH